MALLGNYSVLTKMPLRFRGGSTTSVEPQLRSNYGASGPARNAFARANVATGLNLYSVPTGCYPPYTWVIPKTAGEISSRQNIVGAGSSGTPSIAAGWNLGADLAGSGDIPAFNAQLINWAVASLVGSGSVVADGIPVAVASATLTGSGSVSAASLAGVITAAAALIGSGSLDAAIVGVATVSASADLYGSGAVSSAIATALASCQAALAGGGSQTATAIPARPATADLVGSATVSGASLTGLGWMVDSIVGNASLDATISALGTLQSAIKSYGDLTPEGMRDAIWNAVASNYNTAGTMGQKVNAASTGGVDLNDMSSAVWNNGKALTVGKFLGLK